jgi:hypothetical protein
MTEHTAENDARCACGALTLRTTASERHDRGLHGSDLCIGHPSPDTDGEPCEWCQDCACSVTEHHAWTDRVGDVWQYGIDGLMHTPETTPFPREHVEKKWGPLRLARVHPPVVIDITGGPLSPDERAIHAKYQSDDPGSDYYDPTPIPPAKTERGQA